MLLQLDNNNLTQFFPVLDSSNSHHKQEFNPYNFVNRRSNQLVVTVGASWTWGNYVPIGFDSDVVINNDLHQYRIKHVYGNLLAEKLNADFLNLAANGSSNFWASARIIDFLAIADRLHYDKIYLIWTSTDPGKGFNSHEDLFIDYNFWFRQIKQKKLSLNLLLQKMNSLAVDLFLERLHSNTKIIFRIGTDAVDSIGFENIPKNQQLPTWANLSMSTSTCHVIDNAAVTRLKTALDDFIVDSDDQDKYKSWIIDIVDRACLRRSQILKYSNDLFPEKTALHPNEKAHSIWAELIFRSL